MSSEDEAATSAFWYGRQLDDWGDSGWDISGIQNYLSENSETASEALLRVEYLVNLSSEMKSRLDFEWLEQNITFKQQINDWLDNLQDPLNAELVKHEYELWAKQNRSWELTFDHYKNEWNSVGKGEQRLLFLARCDSLDSSSHSQVSVLSPLFKSPEMAEKIDAELSLLEHNEARQKRTIFSAIETLREQGYEVDYVMKLPMIEALEEILLKQKIHTEHELIRLLIIDELSQFDDDIALDYEERRQLLLGENNDQKLIDLKSKVLAISDDLYKRLAEVNDTIIKWREKGIIFPHDDAIIPEELFEWETNLPEIEHSVNQHHEWLIQYQHFVKIWPDVAEEGKIYAGYLENTERLIDTVEDLQQEWRRIELECFEIIERFQDQGLVLEGFNSIIEQDPKNALDMIEGSQHLWQHRVDCISQLLKIDISFEGGDSINKRIALLKEIEADQDVLDDTELMIETFSKRRARHRRMLESELLSLIKQGKAEENTPSSTFTLSDFEQFIADSRRYGLSKNISRTGNSVITGSVAKRLETKLINELSQYSAAGWYVDELLSLLEENPLEVAKNLGSIRPLISNHDALRRRLSALPWNRDTKLAIQVQEQLQDPMLLASLNDKIPSFMRHLSTQKVEDKDFEFLAWKPESIRKTLLPIPEEMASTKSTLEDAHEAMLDAMEEVLKPRLETKAVEPKTEIISKLEEKTPSENEVIVSKITEPPSIQHEVEQSLEPPIINEVKEVNESKTEEISLDTYEVFLQRMGLNQVVEEMAQSKDSSLKILRKGLANHVGIEPRDTRIDRMLRITLRLLPMGDKKDKHRSMLIQKMSNTIPKYSTWMKSRLEARHSGAKGNFLADAINLGNALDRIPGPGFPLPLSKDEKSLPNSNEIEKLALEVANLIASIDLPSASGVVIAAN